MIPVESQVSYLGVGFYTYSEAAQIIGIAPAKLRRWARDYRYFTHDFRTSRPLLTRYFDPDERILSFVELIELLFISLFREEGLSLQAIRKAAQTAAELFSTDYPFAVKRFATDGRHIFATLSDRTDMPDLMAELIRGQYAFPTVIEPFLRKIEYRKEETGDDFALAFWPLGRDKRVVLDPARSFGRPIDAATGVPTSVLYSAVQAEGEGSVTRVARWYEVPVEAVDAAIAFERTLRAA